jgi:hypothetical protein
MANGLRRAIAAARATRKGTCPECGRSLTLRAEGRRVLPQHGPMTSRCPGSGKPAKAGSQ